MTWTYASLTTAIQDYTEANETSFNNHIPDFIRMAEERLLKTVQHSVFKKQASITVTSGTSNKLEFPTDFLAPLNFPLTQTKNSSTSNVSLEQKDLAFVLENDKNQGDNGDPKYYAIISSTETDADSNFPVTEVRVSPKANGTYTGTLVYLYRPTSLVDTSSTADYAGTGTTGTTWLSTNAPRAMLYGSLVEAYIYLKGETDILTFYEKQFQEALLSLKNLGEAKETQDEFRQGQVTRQKQ